MGGRLRAMAVVAIVLLAGAFIGSAVSQWWGTPSGPGPGGSQRPGSAGRVRVEVLNGGGVSGRAGEATDALRNAGFDVVLFGNAGTFDRDSSVVLDRLGGLEAARAVADVLGIRNVRSEPDSNLYLDVSVVLGREWTPVAERLGEDEMPNRAWWDPRGWFGS
jgi:hypothetical protein